MASEDPLVSFIRSLAHEVYWVTSISEAADIVLGELSKLNSDELELLLDRMREALDPYELLGINVPEVNSIAERFGEETALKVALLKDLVEACFSIQGTGRWRRLSMRRRSLILAMLFKVAIGLKYAMAHWPSKVEDSHLDYALSVAELLADELRREGLSEALEGLGGQS